MPQLKAAMAASTVRNGLFVVSMGLLFSLWTATPAAQRRFSVDNQATDASDILARRPCPPTLSMQLSRRVRTSK
jgi:hypothetical protein